MTDFIKLQGIFENGYGFIAKKVMKDKRLHIYSKAIYSYICSYSGKGNDAFPSQKLICDDLGISKDTLSKYLKPLKELGYITTNQENKGGKFSNTIYTVNIIPCIISSDTVTTDTDDNVYGKIDTNNNNIYNNNNINNNNNNKHVDVLSDNQKKYREEVESKKKVIRELLRLYNLNITVEQLVMYSKGDLDRVIRNIKIACNGKYTNPVGALVNSVKGGYDLQVLKDIDEKKDFFTKYKKSISVLEIAYNNGKFDGEQLVWAEEILRGEGRI